MPYPGYPGKQVEGCDYEDAVFTDFIKNAILQHDTEVRPTCLTACLCASALYLPLYIRLYCAFAFDAAEGRWAVCLLGASTVSSIDALLSRPLTDDASLLALLILLPVGCGR